MHANPGAGKPVLECNFLPVFRAISIYRQYSAARSRRGGHVGSAAVAAMPRRAALLASVDACRQGTDLRIDDPDLRIDAPDLRVDGPDLLS